MMVVIMTLRFGSVRLPRRIGDAALPRYKRDLGQYGPRNINFSVIQSITVAGRGAHPAM